MAHWTEQHFRCDRCQDVYERSGNVTDLPRGWRNVKIIDSDLDLCQPCRADIMKVVKADPKRTPVVDA